MAISFVGASANGGMSISSMPSHAAGDMLIIWYCTINSAPTVADGWIVLSRTFISTLFYTLAYKIAVSDSEVSGTWTHSLGASYSAMCCAVYRSDAGRQLVAGSFSNTGGISVASGGNVNYAASNPDSPMTQKWQVGMICHRMHDTDINVAPTGMTARCNANGSVGAGAAMHDTNANDASWPSTNYTLTAGSAAAYRTHVLELIETDFEAGGGGGNIIIIED